MPMVRPSPGPNPPFDRQPAPSAPLRLGTRRSPLALAQAEEARARICAAHAWPADAIALVPVTASGDRIQDRPLAEIGGKALWTKELDASLLTREIDFAVHSAKDVETLRPPGIVIAAVLPRADVRDVLLGAASVRALPQGARVGTSAPRRAAQLLHARPDCIIVPFRGNVATRIARLAAGEADATFLAAAGLQRLGETGVGRPLDVEHWLPAPGQGAIAIEARADDGSTRAILAAIDDAPSRLALLAERALLAALGGSCHSPIAALARIERGELELRAALFSPDGAERIAGEIRFVADDDGASGNGGAPARLAADLLDRAPRAVADHFAGPASAA